MTKVFLCLSVILYFLQSTPTYYYVSNTGSDANTGTSPNTPFRTLARLNKVHPKPGDHFLLKSNEFLYGSIITNTDGSYQSPIVIATYGGTAPAVVSGTMQITKWYSLGNGIYYTDSLPTQSDVSTVILDNKLQGEGRYPNDMAGTGGFLVFESAYSDSTRTTIISSQIPNYGIDESYNGSNVHVKSYLSTLENCGNIIVKGNTLSFDNTKMGYQIQRLSGLGFFLSNNIKTLDLLGEWYFNTKNKRLYMYFGSQPPTAHKTEVSCIDILLEPRNSHYIVNNIVFRGGNKYGISCNWDNRKDLLLDNIKVLRCGTGIALNNLQGFRMQNSTIEGMNNNGLNIGYKVDSPFIYNSSINDIGMQPANLFADVRYQRRSGYGIFSGPQPTKGLHLQNTSITNTAFMALYFTGSNNYIYRNYISDYCMLLDDGGGIYMGGGTGINTTNNIVRRNIVRNGYGYDLGFPAQRPIPVALFFDDRAGGCLADSNYLENSRQCLVVFHNASNVTVRNNQLVNGKYALAFLMDNETGPRITNVNFFYNQFLSTDTTQLFYSLACSGLPTDNYITGFGTLNLNTFISQNVNTGIFAHADTFNTPTSGILSLSQFKQHGFDVSSKPIQATEVKHFYCINDTLIQIPGTWQTPDGKLIQDKVWLKDHTGIILIKYTAAITLNTRQKVTAPFYRAFLPFAY